MTDQTKGTTELTSPDAAAEAAKAAEVTAAAEATKAAEAAKVAEAAKTADAAGTQTAEETAAEAAKIADGKAKTDGAPETYADFKLPEGMEIDKVAMEGFTPVAKELNLSQEQAQKLVDYEAKRVQEMVDGQETAWQTVQEEWRTATKADKEIGGEAFDTSLAAAKTFLNAFGTPELMTALDETGTGNHLEFIRAFAKAGKAMGEDKLIAGQASLPARTQAETLFPDQN